VMREMYTTYYREQQRGYTEEEFWDTVAQMAGKPLTELRHYVETTETPDYEKYLSYGALSLDLSLNDDPETERAERAYELQRKAPENKLQEEIRKALFRYRL